jgi:hypothetical protein
MEPRSTMLAMQIDLLHNLFILVGKASYDLQTSITVFINYSDFEISGCHGGEYENDSLLGYSAVQTR